MKSPLWQLTTARLREFFREPAAIFWVYGFPLLLAVSLGIAFRDRPVEKIPIDVVTDAFPGTTIAEEMKAALVKDERIEVHLHDRKTATNRLRTGKTSIVVIPSLPTDTSTSPWEYLLDPNRPECILARSAADNALLRQTLGDTNKPAENIIDEPGGRYIDFLIPGLIGTNLMGGGLFGVGFVIVDMRVRKLLKRYLATPMRKSDFMLSIMLSRMLFTFIEVALLLLFAHLAFDIHVYGNWFALITMLFLGGTCFAGIGLLIASRAKTIETVSGLMNMIMLPMYVLSGVFFSSERFPDMIQPFIKILPLTAFNTGARAVMNDGAGFDAILQPALILLFWTTSCFIVALRIFRWR